MFTRIIICCAFILFLAHSEDLQIPVVYTEAVVGQEQVILQCRTDVMNTHNPVEWHHKVNKDADRQFVYKRGLILNGYLGRFQVFPNATTGQYDLIITGVTLDDAGAYTCMGKNSQSKAELIVFEKYPSNDFCLTNSPLDGFLGSNDCGLESDTVRMSCDIKYRGNLAHVLEWMNGENVITSAITSDANGVSKSFIEMKADQLQTSTFTCRVKNPHSLIFSRLTWSTRVNVTSIRNATTMPYIGCDQESVDCSAGHHQDCTYSWLLETGTELTSSSTIKLTDRPTGNYTCLSKCNLRQMPCSYVAKIFNYQCSQIESQIESQHKSHLTATNELPMTYPLEIYIPVGILLVVVAIALVLAFLFRRVLCACGDRRRLSNDSEAGEGRQNFRNNVLLKDETLLQESLVPLTMDRETKQTSRFDNGAKGS